MKLFAVILIFVICFIPCSASYSQNSSLKDSILSRISSMKKQTQVKSIIAGVWEGKKEIMTVALGESMTEVPASTDMHLRIGGVSETFLGTLLMILAEQGKIRLDEKISKWMPELFSSDKVTVEMLIKNTAGYKDYVLNQEFIELVTNEPFRSISREDIYSFAEATITNNFAPGTQQKYSHTEFTMLGEILEKATGRTMAELFEENIFRPLNLEHTGYSKTAELPYPVLHAFSTDRKIFEDATYWNPSWSGESGALYSNISDLGKWAYAFGTGMLLKPESFKLLISRPESAARDDLYFASGFVVANGWFVQNPNFNGYSGAFGYFPEKEITVILYTTQSAVTSSGAQAFNIFKELVKMLTPEAEINF